MIQFHLFRGKRYRIKPYHVRRGGTAGYCDPPDKNGKAISIPINGSSSDDLDYIIHECLHACFWDLEEIAVERAADDISRLLWRLGWRKK